MLSRRSFLSRGNKACAALAVSILTPSLARGNTLSREVSIRPKGTSPIAPVADDFAGLGYEMFLFCRASGLAFGSQCPLCATSQKSRPKRRAAPRRRCVSFSRYEPQAQVMTEPKNTIVTQGSLEQLSAFLRAVGWTALWSVNFGTGTLQEAIEEARAVASILGDHLQAIEIGNEVDLYGHYGQHPLRRPPYNYETYSAEYAIWHSAISKAVPGLRFAAPDATNSAMDWAEKMAKDAHGDVQLLTVHYYRGGQQRGTAEGFEIPGSHLGKQARAPANGFPTKRYSMADVRDELVLRRGEAGSERLPPRCPLDFGLHVVARKLRLLWSQHRDEGVNEKPGVVSSYSPIQDDGKGNNTAGVPYYGMLACATAMNGSTKYCLSISSSMV